MDLKDVYTEEVLEAFNNTHPKGLKHRQEHYKQHKFEPIDIIEEYCLNFNLGNIVKYSLRSKYKGQEIEDLEKVVYYANRELERAKRERT